MHGQMNESGSIKESRAAYKRMKEGETTLSDAFRGKMSG